MRKKILTGLAITAISLPAAYASAQFYDDRRGAYESECTPMLREARSRVERVDDDDARGQIKDTISRAEEERRVRNYGACANLAQVALNQIDRNEDRDRDRDRWRNDNPLIPDIFKDRRR